MYALSYTARIHETHRHMPAQRSRTTRRQLTYHARRLQQCLANASTFRYEMFYDSTTTIIIIIIIIRT